MISEKEYTLQINLKSPVRVTSHNKFQVVKAEISAVIDCYYFERSTNMVSRNTLRYEKEL